MYMHCIEYNIPIHDISHADIKSIKDTFLNLDSSTYFLLWTWPVAFEFNFVGESAPNALLFKYMRFLLSGGGAIAFPDIWNFYKKYIYIITWILLYSIITIFNQYFSLLIKRLVIKKGRKTKILTWWAVGEGVSYGVKWLAAVE